MTGAVAKLSPNSCNSLLFLATRCNCRICKSLDFECDASSCDLLQIYQIGFVIGRPRVQVPPSAPFNSSYRKTRVGWAGVGARFGSQRPQNWAVQAAPVQLAWRQCGFCCNVLASP